MKNLAANLHALGMLLILGMPNDAADPSAALGAQDEAAPNATPSRPSKPEKNCANPDCKIVFQQKRRTQRFCSVKCRNEEFWSRNKRVTVPVMPEQQPSTKTTS